MEFLKKYEILRGHFVRLLLLIIFEEVDNLRSSISISKCLSRIKELDNQDRDDFIEELRNQALNEIRLAVQNIIRRKNINPICNFIIHVHPRRFVFYGEIGVTKKCTSNSLYKICLPIECWVKSDMSVSQNEFFVVVE